MFRIGGLECLIILILLTIVVGLAFRSGIVRGRGRKG